MATKLKSALRRELDIEGKPYMLTLTPEGLKLTQKGRRKGHELAWRDFVRGEAALAVALNASLAQSVDLAPAKPPARPARKPAALKKGKRVRRA
jgi:hypothetical protein